MYWRVLRLGWVRPNGWQRAVLVEGVLLLAVVLVLSDAASPWTILVLPAVAAVLVKAHDVLLAVAQPKERDRASRAGRSAGAGSDPG